MRTTKKAAKKRKAYMREYYRAHSESEKANVAKRRLTAKRFINAYKAFFTCQGCGLEDPAQLQLHHLRPSEREFIVGKSTSYSLLTLVREMEKTVTLCAACHRRYHAIAKKLVQISKCVGALSPIPTDAQERRLAKLVDQLIALKAA